jgi:hypothetical protein
MHLILPLSGRAGGRSIRPSGGAPLHSGTQSRPTATATIPRPSSAICHHSSTTLTVSSAVRHVRLQSHTRYCFLGPWDAALGAAGAGSLSQEYSEALSRLKHCRSMKRLLCPATARRTTSRATFCSHCTLILTARGALLSQHTEELRLLTARVVAKLKPTNITAIYPQYYSHPAPAVSLVGTRTSSLLVGIRA